MRIVLSVDSLTCPIQLRLDLLLLRLLLFELVLKVLLVDLALIAQQAFVLLELHHVTVERLYFILRRSAHTVYILEHEEVVHLEVALVADSDLGRVLFRQLPPAFAADVADRAGTALAVLYQVTVQKFQLASEGRHAELARVVVFSLFVRRLDVEGVGQVRQIDRFSLVRLPSDQLFKEATA